MRTINDLLIEMREHQKADRLTQGQWWENGKGCFYGCAMQTAVDPIERACEKYNMPLWIGYWSEAVFEGLSKEDALIFPVDFLEKLCAFKGDTEKLKHNLAVKRLTVLSNKNKGAVKAAIDSIISLHKNYDAAFNSAWSAARSAARSAAEAAARSAAWSAWSAAESAAWSAAESAARSAAESADWSARSAAWSAAESADWSAESAARSAAFPADWSVELDFMYELLNEGVK